MTEWLNWTDWHLHSSVSLPCKPCLSTETVLASSQTHFYLMATSLCNWAGSYGAFLGQTQHILCFSSSLKYPDNSIWCTCPELFHRCENLPPNRRCELYNDLQHVAPRPPGTQGLIMLNRVITFLLSHHHQPIRELCVSWSHTLGPSSFTWHFKNAVLRKFPGGAVCAVVRAPDFHCQWYGFNSRSGD